jgi:signal transduction histidine kinase
MADPTESPRKGNILVVDDTPANLRLLTQMLGEQGYRVRPVPSGARALDAARAEPPDLILLDIKMPGMDGYQVCEALKATPQTREIPVIFISAIDEVEDKVKAFLLGGVDYITKPFQFEEVLARVETHLTIANLQQQLQAYAEDLERRVAEKVREVERERAKAVQMDKMAALGEMATGIAHELNQPLTAIAFEADYLRQIADKALAGERPVEGPLDAPELHEVGENLAADVVRCRRIIDHLRTFGRVSQDFAGPIDLNQPIEDSFILVGARLRNHNVAVELSLAQDLPPIHADPHKLEQVVLNLISNAEHAMEQRAAREASQGATGSPTGYHKTLTITTCREGDSVVATVRDNGCGIPAEAQPQVFEAFFTTKPSGEGTGLGLSISREIVTSFNGEITFESAEDVGTTFTLRFPAGAGET